MGGTILGVLAGALAIVGLASGGGPIFWATTAVLGAVAVLFGALTVRVEGGRLRWWFGPGLWTYERALSEIVAARPTRNRWWYGWGIRATLHGWLYNVSGLGAVEIETRDGRRLRIGSDEPERLAAAIEAARG